MIKVFDLDSKLQKRFSHIRSSIGPQISVASDQSKPMPVAALLPYLSTQWAAVRIKRSLMIVPPQNCLLRLRVCRAT